MKNKTCRSCAAFRQTYQKSVCRYWKCKRFYCRLREQLLYEAQGCADWKPAKKCEYDLSSQRLQQVEEDIRRIADLVCDRPQNRSGRP